MRPLMFFGIGALYQHRPALQQEMIYQPSTNSRTNKNFYNL